MVARYNFSAVENDLCVVPHGDCRRHHLSFAICNFLFGGLAVASAAHKRGPSPPSPQPQVAFLPSAPFVTCNLQFGGLPLPNFPFSICNFQFGSLAVASAAHKRGPSPPSPQPQVVPSCLLTINISSMPNFNYDYAYFIIINFSNQPIIPNPVAPIIL